MSNSLRDQLLGLGYKPAPEFPKPARVEQRPHPDAKTRDDSRPRQDSKPGDRRSRPQGARPEAKTRPAADARRAAPPKPGSRAEFDLGKAYALRAQKEKDERIALEQAKQEQARLRREARAKLVPLLEGKALNDPAAEHVRHFEYGGKIKRIHVTAEQLAALNRGELGVLQSEGRYLLVDAGTLTAAEAVFADAVALKVDPNAPAADDPYSDPAYQVPDDLIW